MKKRTIFFTLALMLCLALIPSIVLAADVPWAEPAVTELNAVYGGSPIFAADETSVTESNAKTLFATLKSGFNAGSTFSGNGNAKRGQVCETVWNLCDGLLGLPEGVQPRVFSDTEGLTAVNSLAALGIVNGKGDGTFAPDDGVTNAELAIIVHRTFNKMGGVQAAKDLLNGTGNFGGGFSGFSDVPPGHWAYDGVMYLQSMGILKGKGDGSFDPAGAVDRYSLAVVALKTANVLDGKDVDAVYTSSGAIALPGDVPGDHWSVALGIVLHALEGNYMTTDASGNFNGERLLTREEAGLAVINLYEDYDPTLVNLSVLDRFTDGASVTDDYKEAMAYLVSIGIFHGTAEGQLIPTATMSRAEIGIFLARVMQGLDPSKMLDYDVAVKEALS